MTTAAAIAPLGPPPSSPSPPQPPSSPSPVVVLRSAKVPSSVVVEHPGAVGSPAVVRVLHKDTDARTTSASTTLKTLSNDLSELLVKNLSLKRNSETCCGGGAAEDPSSLAVNNGCPALSDIGIGIGVGGGDSNSDSLNLINRSRGQNRNSLCDTFSSVNKLIKLKRVSSDSSSISGYTKIHSGDVTHQHSINPPPQAKFKRVEISVQELSGELVNPRKSIIVNQFDQLAPHESESVPLLVNRKRAEAKEEAEEEEGPEEAGKEVEKCDSSLGGVKFRRRIQHPPRLVRGVGGSILEPVEEERYKRRSLQWPLGLGGWGGEGVTAAEESSAIDEEETADGVGEERRRKTHFRHSWNAPGYDLLLEEDRGVDSRKVSLFTFYNSNICCLVSSLV